MSDKDTEIRADLTLNDRLLSGAIEKAKGAFESLHEKAGEVLSDVKGFISDAAATALGFQLSGLVDTAKEALHEAFENALEPTQEIKGIANALAMTDKLGHSFEELHGKAVEYNDELEGMGLAAGASGGEMIAAFTDISEITKRSSEATLELVDHMATASKAVPGGIAEMTRGMVSFEQGIVKAKNPLVQMIAATGLMKGNTKEIAKQLQKMKPSDAIAIAEEAIDHMASKMEDVPLDAKQLMTNFADLRGEVFEALGTPFLNSLAPHLQELRDYWIENKTEFEDLAKSLGEKIGEWVTDAAHAIKDGFDALENHSDDIKKAWETAKSVVNFIIAHRKELAIGAGMAVGGAALSGSGVLGSVGGIGGLASGLGSFLSYVGKADVPLNAMKAGILGIGTSAKSVVSDGIAGLITAKSNLIAKLKETATNIPPAVTGLAALAVAIEAFIFMKQKIDAAMESRSKDRQSLTDALTDLSHSGMTEELKAGLESAKEELTSGIDGMSDEAFKALSDRLISFSQMTEEQTARLKSKADEGAVGGLFEDIAEAYNEATFLQNKESRAYAARLLLDSGFTAQTLVDAGIKLNGGLKGFEELFVGASEETLAKLKKFSEGAWESAAKKNAPKINVHNDFSGSTFNIKQDFRDQDPDRLAIVFKDDILRFAESRRQARIGTAFGL